MKMRVSSLKKSLYVSLLALPLLIASGLTLKYDRSTHSWTHSRVRAADASAQLSPDQVAKIAASYGNLPLSFEKNVGQSNSQVEYLSHGNGYELFLKPNEAVLSLQQSVPNLPELLHRGNAAAARAAIKAQKTSVVRMEFDGANPSTSVSGLQRLAGKTNYFTGNDPKQWHTNVPTYGRVEYSDLYPGVDAVFYGNQRKFEYDLVVSPGANPREIVLDIEGARKLRVDASGNVVAELNAGDVELKKPMAYQMVSGERREVASNYVLTSAHKLAFNVSSFDRSLPLVIDPVLDYSTYIDGSVPSSGPPATPGDVGNGIAVDTAGDAYIVGTTFSSTFPFPANNSIFPTPGAGIAQGAAFVTELNPTGTTAIYSTYRSRGVRHHFEPQRRWERVFDSHRYH